MERASNDWPGSLTNTASQQSCSWYQGPPPIPPIQHTNYWTYYSNWQYTDGYGASHSFSGTTRQINSTDGRCGPTQTTTLDSITTDGTGWSLHAVGSSGTPTSRSGVSVNTSAETATDRNGNRLTLSASNTTYTDTLNTTALTIYAGSSPPSAVQYIWTNPRATTSQATLNFTLQSISTFFQCSGIAEYNNSVYVPTSLSLPDGTSYQFNYQSDGRLHTVTLPTGGPVTYWFYNVNCADGSDLIVYRDPNNQPRGIPHWAYTRAQVSGAEWTTTVEAPISPATDTVFTFQGNYPTLQQIYSSTIHDDAIDLPPENWSTRS